MKSKFIKDLQFSDELTAEEFAVKNIRKGKTLYQRDYINLMLTDKTGEVEAKIWEDKIPACEIVEEGDIVELSGKVGEFKDKQQITVTYMKKIDQFELENFLPKTQKDPDKLWKKIKNAIAEVKDPFLTKLLNNFFTNKEFTEKYKQAPAAEFIHHAYIGGLMEHTVEMLDCSEGLSKNNPQINNDFLICGILLHDLGKVEELGVRHSIFRTLEGNLVGHISLGAIMVDKEISKIKDFPAETRVKILNMILSHHEKLEFGSPVKPMTIEAFALAHLDNLSAKVNTAIRVKNEGENAAAEFSAKNFALETRLYLK